MNNSTHGKYPVKNHITIFLTFVFLFSLTLNVQASDPIKRTSDTTTEETIVNVNDRVIVTARVSVGVLNGEALETVYRAGTGAKLSEITWSFDNNIMLGTGISIDLNHWLKLNGDIWFKITESSAMDDYDWFVENGDWSHHDNVDLSSGSMFDINAEISFYQPQNFTFFGIVGLKKDNWAWDAKGGSYIYSVNGFRNTTGTFPNDQSVISYEQEFTVPYFGIGFSTGTENLFFSARLIGSPFVDASADDTHHLRNLQFKDEFSSGTMIAVGLTGAYNFTESFSANVAFQYQNYSEIKGYTIVTNTVTGQSNRTADDTAGISQSSSLLSLGVRYTF